LLPSAGHSAASAAAAARRGAVTPGCAVSVSCLSAAPVWLVSKTSSASVELPDPPDSRTTTGYQSASVAGRMPTRRAGHARCSSTRSIAGVRLGSGVAGQAEGTGDGQRQTEHGRGGQAVAYAVAQ
jgi:hypothetical protein